MIIKQPPGYDVSHWEGRINWGAVTPRPRIVWCKATEGDFYTDDTFAWNFSNLATHGIYRGAYHFHRKAVSAVEQGKRFCDVVRPHITAKDYLVLDVEEGGETAAQLRAWFEYVRNQFVNNPVMIYSRKNLLDPIPMVMAWLGFKPSHPLNAIQMTQAERDYFRQIPVWTAGYPNNPDLYNSVPAFYVPDQTKWGPVWAWQYSEQGSVTGVNSEIDLDWLAPEFLVKLSEPVPVDNISMIFDGVKSIAGTRYGCKFYLKVSDLTKVHFEVVHLSTGDRRELPSNIARLYEAQMAWNGADWNKLVSPAVPLGPAVSGGVTYIPRSEADPSLIFFEDGSAVIEHKNLAGQYEVTTGVRYLVVAGEVASYLYGSEPQYTERHARSVDGIDGNGHVMRLTVDGEWPDKGMLLRECAELMRSFGAVKAFDTGGGGDSVEVINGEVTSIPADRDGNGNPAERRVPQFLLAYVKEPSMTDYYEYTALGNRAIRTGPGATYGRIASGSDFLTNTKAKGGATAADRVTLTAETAPPVQGMAGDVWVKVYDNNGRAVDGWTAYIHRGVAQITQKLIGTTPPPVAQFAVLDITVTDPNTGKKYGGTGIQLPEVP